MKQKRKHLLTVVLVSLCIISIIGLVFGIIVFSAYISNNEVLRSEEYMLDVTEKSAIAANDKVNGYVSSLKALACVVSCGYN